MSEPFVAEIRIFGFNFAPVGWAQCEGQLLPIAQNAAVFSLLGTSFGGDGRSTFGCPTCKATRLCIGERGGPSVRDIGETEGEATITLTSSQIPAHTHPWSAIPATETTTGLPAASGLRMRRPIMSTPPLRQSYGAGRNLGPGRRAAAQQSSALPGHELLYCPGRPISVTELSRRTNVDERTIFSVRSAFSASILPPRVGLNAMGKLLPIAQDTALFSLLGTTYGGTASTTSRWPDLARPVTHAPRRRLCPGPGRRDGIGNSQYLGDTRSYPPGELQQRAHHTKLAPCRPPATTGRPTPKATRLTPPRPIVNWNRGDRQQRIEPAPRHLAPYTVLNFCMALAGSSQAGTEAT